MGNNNKVQFNRPPGTISLYKYTTSAGPLVCLIHGNSIFHTYFDEYNHTRGLQELDPKNYIFHQYGTPFQIKVWQATMKVPAGTVISYQKLAQKIGAPKAYRAVANALGANPIVYFVPCHRIIRSNGELGGYTAGIERKKLLLKMEGFTTF